MHDLLKENDYFYGSDPLFFLDNARIHHSITFIVEALKPYYNFLYNAPYTP